MLCINITINIYLTTFLKENLETTLASILHNNTNISLSELWQLFMRNVLYHFVLFSIKYIFIKVNIIFVSGS